jgi:NTE family protein
LALSSTIKEKAKQCDLYIEPADMSRYSMFDMDKADEIIDFCYEYTTEILKHQEI